MNQMKQAEIVKFTKTGIIIRVKNKSKSNNPVLKK
jgi:hypothetical protein